MPEIVFITSKGNSSRIVGNALRRKFGDFPCIIEERPSRYEVLKRRRQRLGIVPTAGHALFKLLAEPILRLQAAGRIEEICAEHGFDTTPLSGHSLHVDSVNGDQCVTLLRELAPRVVVINRTRIISKRVLTSTEAVFVNMHAGITPSFRGCHGGYWALATGNDHLVGTTVHVVDAGIDTGKVLKQATFTVSEKDSFITYPYLHIATGLPLLLDSVSELLEGRRDMTQSISPDSSKLYYHPTLWGYLRGRLVTGVR